jgi:hypothetical protein
MSIRPEQLQFCKCALVMFQNTWQLDGAVVALTTPLKSRFTGLEQRGHCCGVPAVSMPCILSMVRRQTYKSYWVISDIRSSFSCSIYTAPIFSCYDIHHAVHLLQCSCGILVSLHCHSRLSAAQSTTCGPRRQICHRSDGRLLGSKCLLNLSQ